MPEPEELSIDFSEPSEADLEEEAGFSGEESAEETSEKKEEETEEKSEEESEEEAEEEEESGEEEEDEEPDSAKAAAELRAKEILESLEEEEEEEEPEKKEPPAKKEDPPRKPPRMTKEVVARLLKSIDLDELPEDEVVIGDTSVNLRELANDDPEDFAAKVVLSGAIAEKAIGALLQSGHLVTREQMGNVLEAVNEQLNGYSFWLEVQEKHPDALKIKASDEWKDWITDQPKAMKALAGSQEVEDTIKILDYYKEDIAKAKVASKDDKDRGKKKKKDDLHKHSARTKTEVAGRDKKDTGDSDDEEAGWELGGKE